MLKVDESSEKFTQGRKMHIHLVVTLLTPLGMYLGSLGPYQIQQNWKTNPQTRKQKWNPSICTLYNSFYIQGRRKQFCLLNVACSETSYDCDLSCPKKGK